MDGSRQVVSVDVFEDIIGEVCVDPVVDVCYPIENAIEHHDVVIVESVSEVQEWLAWHRGHHGIGQKQRHMEKDV